MNMRGFGRACAVLVALTLGGCLGDDGGDAEPIDPQRGTLMDTGVEMYRRGAYRQAAEQFDAAMDRARLTDDVAAVYDAAYHAAASRVRLREWDVASDRLDAAKRAAGQLGRSSASVRVLEGAVLRERGRPGAALDAAEAGLAEASGATAGLLHLLRAEALTDLQRTEAAEAARASARQAWSGVTGEPGWSNVRGRLALLRGEPADAARRFEREADRAADRLDYATVAEAMASAGAAWASAGRWRPAANAFLAAARSARQQPALAGRVGDWARQAEAAARRAGADELAQAAASLQPGRDANE